MTLPYSPERVRELLLQPATPLCPDITDRRYWNELAETRYGSLHLEAASAAAEEFKAHPPLPPTFTQAIVYERSGDREGWQNRNAAFSLRLAATVLRACFTADPDNIDDAADAIWAASEISNWVLPAHRREETDDSPGFDLGAAGRGLEISEALQLLGPALDELSPRFRQKLKRDLHERVFTPYQTRDYWFTYPHENKPLNNWTAVCSGGVLIAALAALDDEPELQAQIVAKAAWSLGYFVDVFGENGSLDEGVGYWSYGMSYYVMAAERLYTRTGGQMDLLAHPRWKDVARFPLHVSLYDETYVTFSDCAPRVNVSPGWLMWLGRHLELPEVQAWAARRHYSAYSPKPSAGGLSLRELLWRPEGGEAVEWNTESLEPVQHSPRPVSTYLPDVEWFLARTTPEAGALILAAKGGHNAENHNHNDVGSFVIHYRQESLVSELGAPTYTRQFFGPLRYENLAARSRGHSVPLVNGVEQSVGREFAARVLSQTEDEIQLDLTAAYGPRSGLKSLTRRLRINREGEGSILLIDASEFLQDNGTLELPLIVVDNEVLATPKAGIIGGREVGLFIQANSSHPITWVRETVENSDPRFMDEQGRSRIRRLWAKTRAVAGKAEIHLEFSPFERKDLEKYL